MYVESQEQYAQVRQIGRAAARARPWRRLPRRLGGDVLLVNPTSFSRARPGLLAGELQGGAGTHADGRPLATQAVEGGLLLDAGELPPFSVTPLRSSADGLQTAPADPMH